jgi:hypothetical protein
MTPSPRDFHIVNADRGRGLYHKYDVTRVNDTTGKHRQCDYFVLDWRHDPYAVVAARAYAHACEAEFPVLARDLRQRADTAETETRRRRLRAVERALEEAKEQLSLVLCQCPPRGDGDVRITLVPATHNFSCAYRQRMQGVLRLLNEEDDGG